MKNNITCPLCGAKNPIDAMTCACGGELYQIARPQATEPRECNKYWPQKNPFWPSIVDLASAKHAIKFGITAASIVAVISSIAGFLSGKPLYESGVVDGILFAIIAFGLYKNSRVAAILGLIIYSLEATFTHYINGKIGGISPLLILFFIHSLRGTFAYHKLKLVE